MSNVGKTPAVFNHLVGKVAGDPWHVEAAGLGGQAGTRARWRGRVSGGGRAGALAHSITSLARASTVSGTVRPSPLAVFRLTTSSYLVGACTGRAAGLFPLRMPA